MRTLKDYILLYLKGIAMGSADLIPGVSGGTIAFISGIYEELFATINAFNFEAFKKLKNEGIVALWKHINGNFLVALFLGIGTSFISLSKLISYLLKEEPVLLWGFFFGLIVASVFLVGKQVKKWTPINVIGLIIGVVIAFLITILPPIHTPEAIWFIFLSGAIAICAMILPGISGSFILLLLGSYEFILTALKDVKIAIIGVFMAGCITGLLSFSKLLNWLFKKHHNLTVAILTGFLIGSLNKIWPWKKTLEFFIKHKGGTNEELVPLLQKNVLPQNFDGDSQLLFVILAACTGLTLILILERLAPKS